MFGEVKDYGFKFKIGQMVKTVFHVSSNPNELSVFRRNRNVRMFIVERVFQECPGGIQRHYICRPGGDDGDCGKDYNRFNEIELREVVDEKEKP